MVDCVVDVVPVVVKEESEEAEKEEVDAGIDVIGEVVVTIVKGYKSCCE